MAKFIQLTMRNGQLFHVNIDHIITFENSKILLTNNNGLLVQESDDEIVEKILTGIFAPLNHNSNLDLDTVDSIKRLVDKGNLNIS